MRLRELLEGYSDEIIKIKNEFRDYPEKKIQGFMNDSSNDRIISFDIRNDIVENLQYLLGNSTKVRCIYFEGICKY